MNLDDVHYFHIDSRVFPSTLRNSEIEMYWWGVIDAKETPSATHARSQWSQTLFGTVIWWVRSRSLLAMELFACLTLWCPSLQSVGVWGAVLGTGPCDISRASQQGAARFLLQKFPKGAAHSLPYKMQPDPALGEHHAPYGFIVVRLVCIQSRAILWTSALNMCFVYD